MGNLVDRTGEVYADSLKIIKELGENRVVCRCLFCGKVEEYNKGSLVNGGITTCKYCKDIKEYRLKIGDEIGGFRVNDFRQGMMILAECVKCNSSLICTRTEFVSGKLKCSKCGTSKLNIDRKGEKFGTLLIIADNGNNEVRCTCENCGAIDTYIKSNIVNNGTQCKRCGNSAKMRYLKNLNVKNKVFNGLLVTSETSKSKEAVPVCQVKCLFCGQEYRFKKGAVITRRVRCKSCRDNVKFKCVCKNCGKEVGYSLNSSSGQCPYCGTLINIKPLIAENDTRLEILHNEKLYGAEIKNGKLVDGIQLLSILYHGRDLEIYYDAICLKHNKRLVISDKELKNLDKEHSLCMVDYNMELHLE